MPDPNPDWESVPTSHSWSIDRCSAAFSASTNPRSASAYLSSVTDSTGTDTRSPNSRAPNWFAEIDMVFPVKRPWRGFEYSQGPPPNRSTGHRDADAGRPHLSGTECAWWT